MSRTVRMLLLVAILRDTGLSDSAIVKTFFQMLKAKAVAFTYVPSSSEARRSVFDCVDTFLHPCPASLRYRISRPSGVRRALDYTLLTIICAMVNSSFPKCLCSAKGNRCA